MSTIHYELENEESTEVVFEKYTLVMAELETTAYREEFDAQDLQPPILIVGHFWEAGAPGSTYENAAYLWPDGTARRTPPEATTTTTQGAQ